MKNLRGQFTVELMARLFEVSRSSYYAWLNRPPSKRAQGNARLEIAIRAAHVHRHESHGLERLQGELAADGFPVGVSRIKRLLTTNSDHSLPMTSNLLQQDFSTDHPGQV